MERCVGAPWPPRGGSGDHLLLAWQGARCLGEGLPHTEIGGRKGIGKAECAHGDILCGPLADAADFAQGGNNVLHRCARRERELATVSSMSEFMQAGRSC